MPPTKGVAVQGGVRTVNDMTLKGLGLGNHPSDRFEKYVPCSLGRLVP